MKHARRLLPLRTARHACWGIAALLICCILGGLLFPAARVAFAVAKLVLALALIVVALTGLRCPKCGRSLGMKNQICPGCGAKLEEDEP